MSFGMRIWGANGALQLDENSFTVRIIYSAIVQRTAGGGVFVDIAITGVNPTEYSAICIPIGSYPQDPTAQNAYAVQYEPQVNNGSVRVYFNNRLSPSGASGLAAQRLLVMKIR